jgi:hypothetical protein
MSAIANKFRQRDSNARIQVRKDHVLVNGTIMKECVKTPTTQQVLMADDYDVSQTQNVEFTTSNAITEKDSTFRAYYSAVKTPREARYAYLAMTRDPDAAVKSHLISAHNLRDGSFGWSDDGDHGLGRYISRVMEDKGISNAMIFITREYGGTHIGYRRFQIILQLINQLIRQVRPNQQPDESDNNSEGRDTSEGGARARRRSNRPPRRQTEEGRNIYNDEAVMSGSNVPINQPSNATQGGDDDWVNPATTATLNEENAMWGLTARVENTASIVNTTSHHGENASYTVYSNIVSSSTFLVHGNTR